MCFAPQRRALFRHLNFKKCSEPGVCFLPQRRPLFRHLNFRKCSDTGVLYMLIWKCASRHNGVHLFQHLDFQEWSDVGAFCAFWLGHVLRAATACNLSSLIWPDGSAPAALARLLFDPPEPQIIGKTQCFATFLPFRAPASSFLSLFLFSDLLSSSLLFSSLLFSDSSHLCFSISPYCRKFGF